MSVEQSAFWHFSLDFYRRPAVAEACLALQDKGGADVNVLLFLLFIATHGREVTREAVAAIDACVVEWQRAVVQPLRSVRRQLRHGPRALATESVEALHHEIARVELEAERLEQEALWAAFAVETIGTATTVAAAAEANLDAYAALKLGLPVDARVTLLREFAVHVNAERGHPRLT